jgi:hypothetical protein
MAQYSYSLASCHTRVASQRRTGYRLYANSNGRGQVPYPPSRQSEVYLRGTLWRKELALGSERRSDISTSLRHLQTYALACLSSLSISIEASCQAYYAALSFS